MKSPLIKIFVKVLACLILIGAVFYFIIMPKLNELIVNQIALEKISSEYKQADDQLADLNKLAKNQATLDATKEVVFSYLPDEPSASNFIVSLEQMTSQIPIIIDSLRVSEVKPAKTPSKSAAVDSTEKTTSSTTATQKTASKSSEKALEFNASFKTTYDKIITYFSKMESMSRFNTINTISIGSFSTLDSNLSFNATGKIYYGK